jgi:hypothetical protein
MKLFIVTAILLASLTQSASAQSVSSSNRNQAADSKHDKKGQKAKPKRQKEIANAPPSDKSAKAASTQDAAYAAAYKAGIPR